MRICLLVCCLVFIFMVGILMIRVIVEVIVFGTYFIIIVKYLVFFKLIVCFINCIVLIVFWFCGLKFFKIFIDCGVRST